jgi:hypothetical protein
MSVKLDVGNSDILRDWRNGENHSENVDHLKPYFYVVTMISNPVRFSRRWQLYKEFAHRMLEQGVQLMTVEVAFGDRNFEVTHKDNPMNLQLRTRDELWHKENALNLGVSRLPEDWKYVCWMDADIEFENKNWVDETIHALQHYDIVQLFQQALDLGPNGEIMQVHNGFGYCYVTGKKWINKNYSSWHPGYTWCYTKDAFNLLGGMIDYSVLGSADHSMALALIGKFTDSLPTYIHTNYYNMIKAWEENATLHIKHNIGYVPGIIKHYWHGRKKDRKYVSRWNILRDNDFDPVRDLKKNHQGLYMLSGHKHKLRDDIRRYFRQRDENNNTNYNDDD